MSCMALRRSLAVLLLLAPLPGAAAPAAAAVDAVYAALGAGDAARAHADSAALLDRVAETDAQRADALQGRLDVLDQNGELDHAEGAALRAAVERCAAANARCKPLATRLSVYLAIAHKEADAGRVVAQELAAQRASAIDAAEADFCEAQAAFAATGHLDQAHVAAERALTAWHGQRGARAAWHEVELRFLLAFTWSADRARALVELETAARVATERFGADSRARIKMDTERAGVLVSLGRNDEALRLREALLAATRQRYGDASVRTAKAEAMLGASLQELGDYPAARAHYDRAERILAGAGAGEPLERALIAANYGNLLQEMGEEQAALEQYRHALAVYGDSPQRARVRAITYANIGNTEFRLHRYDAAIADFEHALSLREQADGPHGAGLAFSLEGLGSTSLALGRYAQAEQYFRRAIEVRQRGAAANHPTLAAYNFGLALALWGQRRGDDAFRLAEQTARGQQAVLTSFAAEFSERQSVAYRDILVPATALAVTLAAERGDEASVAAAWDLVMAERRLVARAEARKFAAARSAHDPALAARRDAWLRANGALGDAWLDVGTTAERIAQLRAEAEAAERALAAGGRAEPPPTAVALADLARALPADGVLVAFSEGLSSDLARELVAGDKPAPEIAYAFVLGPDGHPALRRVETVNALATLIQSWYRDLRDAGADRERLRSDGLALRRVAFDPFVPGAGPRHVFVVPEGEVFRVSFAALPDAAGGFAIEHGLRAHTLAQESDLVASAGAAGGNALLAGAPAFTAPSGPRGAGANCAQELSRGFAPLPHAQRELDALRDVLAAAEPARRVDLLSGAAATKARVVAALPNAGIVHLATHAFSVESACASASGSLRGVSLQPRTESKSAAAGGLEPVSGLAFAGRPTDAGTLLGAGELSGLDLSQAQWVVLSSCDSGLGPVARNEGVFGMRRALRLAGARTVIMSLWPVDDAATADLMQALYRARFLDHRDVADAMATAMQDVLAARRAAGLSDHPFYWAAFVSEGVWR